MKVILLKEVENLGKMGDIKEVADGYARNFLLPKKFAEAATDRTTKKIEEKKLQIEKNAQAELEEMQKIAEQLEGRELYLKVKEKDGKLFGSVNEKTIVKALKEEGINISPANVSITEPIKEMGDYDIQINLDHGLESSMRIILVGEGA